MTIEPTAEMSVRDRAIKQLKKRRELAAHALVYFLVNSFLVVIWAVTSSGAFFWPVIPMAGWGIGLVMNAWDVFRGDDFTEDEIRREINRLQGAH
jgi:hypothetical protein